MRLSVREQLQRILDQVTYNETYAPVYPREDNTSIDREQMLITGWLKDVSEAAHSEAVARWLEIAIRTIAGAFDELHKGNGQCARQNFSIAIDYLRNAIQRRPLRADFVVGPDGVEHNR